jgi:hypothetical protein
MAFCSFMVMNLFAKGSGVHGKGMQFIVVDVPIGLEHFIF